jgi:hypothetical protein
LSGDKFAQSPSGQGRPGALEIDRRNHDRGNLDTNDGFGINENGWAPPFPPPATRNNGSPRGEQLEYGSQEILTEGAPQTDRRPPVKPRAEDVASLDGSTLDGSETFAPESKFHLTTKPLEKQAGKTGGGNFGRDKGQAVRDPTDDSSYNGVRGLPGAQSQQFTVDTHGK